jgi:hypothetical protein
MKKGHDGYLTNKVLLVHRDINKKSQSIYLGSREENVQYLEKRVSVIMEKFDWKLTIKANIFCLRVVGLWPHEGYKVDFYTVYAFVCLNVFINCRNFFQVANIFVVYDDLEALTGLMFASFNDVLGSVKLYYFVRQMRLFKQLMAQLDQDIFQPKSDEQIALVQPGLFSWKFVYVMLWSPIVMVLLLWVAFPILDGTVKEHRLPFAAWFPYDTNISPLYEITYIYEVIGICVICTAHINMDTMTAALMMYVGTQCDILCDNLKNIKGADYNKKLIRCIQHHKIIVE